MYPWFYISVRFCGTELLPPVQVMCKCDWLLPQPSIHETNIVIKCNPFLSVNLLLYFLLILCLIDKGSFKNAVSQGDMIGTLIFTIKWELIFAITLCVI